MTYGADNNTTVRGLEESHGMSGDGGEVGEGEEEDRPHHAGFHNVTDLTAILSKCEFFGQSQQFSLRIFLSGVEKVTL